MTEPKSIDELKAAATAEKVRANRLRRAASRQALILAKTRTRDPRAVDYGVWTLYDAGTGQVVKDWMRNLDEVEEALR
jgi:hypothetical protein